MVLVTFVLFNKLRAHAIFTKGEKNEDEITEEEKIKVEEMPKEKIITGMLTCLTPAKIHDS